MAAADTASSGAGDMPCPDPSVHQHQNKLSEQASTAALYVTHPERASDRGHSETRENPLGADGKLSSKSAAASLKYAKPQDLPSFPTTGASADSAGKAATLAKDYKMKELWQPEQSLAGSKAAILAAEKGGKLDLWQASATPEGHSAATLAMRNKGLSPNVYTGVDADNRSKALLAATMSHNKGRQRAGSTPAPPPPAYPDSHNSTKNALNAATVSHGTSRSMKGMAPDGWSSEAMQAARIKNVGSRMGGVEQFGEHPTVEIPGEREEATHQAALRASAISMAKTIYETQNRTALTDDPEEIAARAAAGRSSTSTQPDIKQEAMRYINLQEAAHKLASERLAKVDKNLEAARFREYYGYEDKPKRLSSRMSMRSAGGRSRQRNRASSEGTADRDDDSDDEEQARRIRTQMSQLSTGLGQVDQKKQQDDRARLLAAAEKKVSARMHNMNEKVYADTGKIPPALQEEWEAKARDRAQRDRELQAQNPGKTHIGGGKFMDQSDIDAIAAARLKPTLDEITDTAEKKRARDEELRLEKEEQERQKREERAQKKGEKDEQKRVKNEEKAEAKKVKDEEKARKAEEKRVVKEDKRKSREQNRDEGQNAATAGAAGATVGEVAEKVKDDDTADDAAYQKHRSALNRLKEKFRKSQAPEGDTNYAVEEKHDSNVNKSTVAGVAGGAATGATLAEVADHKEGRPSEPLDPQHATHDGKEQVSPVFAEGKPYQPDPTNAMDPDAKGVDAEDPASDLKTARDVHAVDKWNTMPGAATAATIPTLVADDDDAASEADDEFDEPTSRPERPKFEQQPSLVGYGNDHSSEASNKLNLERHISAIPDSDDEFNDDDDDEDWNDERKPQNFVEKDHALAVAERVAAAPVIDRAAAPPEVQSEETASRMDDQRAEAPKDLPSTIEAPGVPKAQLETEPDHKEHTILRQIVNPQGKKHDGEAFGPNAHEISAPSEAKTSIDEKEKPNKLQKSSAPAAAASESKSPTLPSSSGKEGKEKEHKGLRGLFSMFGNKKNKESKYPDFKSVGKDSKDSKQSSSVSYEKTEAGEKPIKTGTAAIAGADHKDKTAGNKETSPTLPQVDAGPSLTGEPTGTEGASGVKSHASGQGVNPRADSPSSFKRGEHELDDLDDVSSSGADEEDVSRGRGGRVARQLGFGNSRTTETVGKGKGPARETGNGDRQNSNTEDEQFEEARDHFDETLAPPPAFAGQAKSESPVSGTKFQEEL
ncbi:Hypothetical predicted protein [Lecanosticta acicola]|uniref:Eisosome protein 1 n=1 Tax=Lecanosticta acicola TaxID=111012 RepID=A0AAI8YT80_9PEZI|nr:Hypothetical predicted protein [Lecanosticta acicola]